MSQFEDMADYDSDSSLEDAAEGTETNVILGFASEQSSEGAISHLGGHPIWFDPAQTPPAEFAKCKVCRENMSLLLQLNGDLPSQFPNDERRLHIFGCRKRQCCRKIGCVRVYREVRKHTPTKSKRNKEPPVPNVHEGKTPQDLGAALFGTTPSTSTSAGTNPFSQSSVQSSVSSNPFSSLGSLSGLAAKPPQRPEVSNATKGSEHLGSASDLAAKPPQQPDENTEALTSTFAEKLKLGVPSSQSKPPPTPSEPWPSITSFPTPHSTLDLESDFELLYPDTDPAQPNGTSSATGATKSTYDAEDSTVATKDADLAEMSLDTTFQKFSHRLSHNPEQVLRYEFAGVPLLYSSNDAVASHFVQPPGRQGPVKGIPRCNDCGSKRVFECQLVPNAISVLEEGQDVGFDDGMDWGTIIVGVCADNCGGEADGKTVMWKEEWLGVQWEERVEYTEGNQKDQK